MQQPLLVHPWTRWVAQCRGLPLWMLHSGRKAKEGQQKDLQRRHCRYLCVRQKQQPPTQHHHHQLRCQQRQLKHHL